MDATDMEKKTESVKVWMSESLKVQLMHLAADNDRALSEYIVHILMLHTYGHARRRGQDAEGAARGDSGRNL
jgi:hypothetical protein